LTPNAPRGVDPEAGAAWRNIVPFATWRRGIIAAQAQGRVDMLGSTAHLSPIRIPYRKFREDP
jgi:hypothetical protein